MSKGSNKGTAFEREVCRCLSKWWTDGERDDVFWRTAGSGAMATTRGKRGRKTHGQYGDVMAVDPIGEPFINRILVEIKRGYSFNPLDLLEPGRDLSKHVVYKWIMKAWRECEEADREFPWIVHKRDRKPTLIYVPCDYLDVEYLSFPNVIFNTSPPDGSEGVWGCGDFFWRIFDFETWLDDVAHPDTYGRT